MKVRGYIKSMAAAATSLSVLTASLTAFDMGASAADDRLNIKVYMDMSMIQNYNDICDDVTYGTYGLPISFVTRLPNVLSYVQGYYGYHGASLNFSSFSTATDLITSPAYECACDSSNYFSTIINGCTGVTSSQCANGNYHCNHISKFVGCTPSYNANNTAVLFLTTSNICVAESGSHFNVDGATNPSAMYSLVRDVDYAYYHPEDYPYAYARMIVAHEIGHFFGVADHYGSNASSDSEPDCVWGSNAYRFDVARSTPACSVCGSTIYKNRNMYKHI